MEPCSSARGALILVKALSLWMVLPFWRGGRAGERAMVGAQPLASIASAAGQATGLAMLAPSVTSAWTTLTVKQVIAATTRGKEWSQLCTLPCAPEAKALTPSFWPFYKQKVCRVCGTVLDLRVTDESPPTSAHGDLQHFSLFIKLGLFQGNLKKAAIG